MAADNNPENIRFSSDMSLPIFSMTSDSGRFATGLIESNEN